MTRKEFEDGLRKDFEKWSEKFYSGLASAADTWDEERQTYSDFAHHMAWCLYCEIFTPKPAASPTCVVCGTTENLTKYPKSYNCNGPKCVAF